MGECEWPPKSRSIQKALRDEANLIHEIDIRWGLLTSLQAAQLVAPESLTTLHQSGQILRLTYALSPEDMAYRGPRRTNHIAFPGFQFTATGSPHPVVGEIIALSRSHGWSEKSVIYWFCSRNGWLDDDAYPADRLADRERLLVAASNVMDQW